MENAWVTGLEIQNYGCIKNVVLKNLNRLHAFIGPNDSGKSTLLRAFRVLSTFAENGFSGLGGLAGEHVSPWDPGFRLADNVWLKAAFSDETVFLVSTSNVGAHLELRKNDTALWESHGTDGSLGLRNYTRDEKNRDTLNESTCNRIEAVAGRLVGTRFVRLDPDAMRRESQLIGNDQEVKLDGDRADGLAGILDAVVNQDADNMKVITDRVRSLFPFIRKIGFNVKQHSSTKKLAFSLGDGRVVPVENMSEGVIYFLGFLSLIYLRNPPILLVEEPENGLHPARIKDVVGVLREISQTTQVLIATHSPLVVNELKPNEVSVVTRTQEKGTIVTPIKDTPNFEERSKVYALGELWLSYADGDTERPLLDGKEP